MKAAFCILSLIGAVIFGAVAGLVIASTIVASAGFAVLDSIFHITPRTPYNDE